MQAALSSIKMSLEVTKTFLNLFGSYIIYSGIFILNLCYFFDKSSASPFWDADKRLKPIKKKIELICNMGVYKLNAKSNEKIHEFLKDAIENNIDNTQDNIEDNTEDNITRKRYKAELVDYAAAVGTSVAQKPKIWVITQLFSFISNLALDSAILFMTFLQNILENNNNQKDTENIKDDYCDQDSDTTGKDEAVLTAEEI